MNAGPVEWGGGIAKSIAYGGALSGSLGRGALLLSAVVHGGLAVAFIGWGEPHVAPPQPIPIAIVAVAPAATPADGGYDATSPGPPLIAPAPHRPATPQPGAAETPAEPPPETAIAEPVPAATESDPVLEAALPEPAVEPRPDPVVESLPVPAAKPAAPAAGQTAVTATETAPTTAAPAAAQTASLPDPASASGTAPDTLETGSAGFAPARYDVAALANPEPDYPWASRRAGEEGRVVLRVEVGAGGIVEAIAVADSSGHRRLDEAALEAVRQWRFEPARIGDRAIATTVNVPVTFRLE